MTITGGAAEPFTPARGRDLVAQLREAGRGAIVVTNGLRDLRLVIGGGEVSLEAAGLALPDGGEVRDLIRAFLCALFWEEPICLFDADASRRDDGPAIRVKGDARETLEQIEQGLTELEPLREKVPSLEVQITVSGEPPPAEEEAPAARLFRAAAKSPGGVMLAQAAEESGIDAIDAAWAAVDLLELKQGAVKRLSPTFAMRRLKRAESAAEDGLFPGLRQEYLARGHARAEPRRATAFLRQAGDAHRFAGRADAAVACYRAALALSPDDVGAREGLVCGLAAQGRAQEVRGERLQLVDVYVAAGLPLRARAHLAELGELTPEQRVLMLQCLLAAGEFADAAQLADRMAPSLPPEEREALPTRFARAGATGAPLARAVRASGVARLRPVRRALIAINLVALVALAVLGVEGFGRAKLREATQRATAQLAGGDFEGAKAAFAELAALSSQARAARWPFHSALREGPRFRAKLDDLAADQALLDASAERLAWRHKEDVVAADASLESLAAAARTKPLKDLIEAERAEIAGYRRRVADEVTVLRDLVTAGRNRDALALARKLVREHSNTRDLFVDRNVPVRVTASPKTAVLMVNGKLAEPLARDSGEWEVRVGLDGQPASLVVSYEGHVSQSREVRFGDLDEPEVSFELVALQKDTSLASTWPVWPESGAAPVRFREDPLSVSRIQANVKGGLELEEAPTQSRLQEALRVSSDVRVSVVAVSEYVRRKVLLRELRLYLEEGGKRATPYRLEIGRVERVFTEEPPKGDVAATAVLHDLGQVPRFPLLVDAIREAVTLMQAELAR